MNKRLILASSMLLCWQSSHADSVSIPWPDFQKLYETHVERRVLDAMPKPAPAPAQRFVMDRAAYTLTVQPDGGIGTVELMGRHLSGACSAIPLFSRTFILTEVKSVTGGTLVAGEDAYPIAFLPSDAGDFSVSLSFMIAASRDNQGSLLEFSGPQALTRSLRCDISPDTILLEAPGRRDADGVYHLAGTDVLRLRYANRSESDAASQRLQVDMATVLNIGDRDIFGTTTMDAPPSLSDQKLVLTLPAGARWLDGDVPGEPIAGTDNRYNVLVPKSQKGVRFATRWALELQAKTTTLLLPAIVENRGEQGRFIVTSPSYTKVSIQGNGVVTGIPSVSAPELIQSAFGKEVLYSRIETGQPLEVAVERLQAVEMPQTILDEVSLRVAFDDNGGILSCLSLQIPAREAALRVKAIEKATIWALTVNGKKQSPYVGPDGDWIIPLAATGASDVELTFLQEGARLGLHGRVEAKVPATGLPTKNLLVFASLPKRLELISMEGPVTAAARDERDGKDPEKKRDYAFSRAYHDGSAVSVALFYKEPATEE